MSEGGKGGRKIINT